MNCLPDVVDRYVFHLVCYVISIREPWDCPFKNIRAIKLIRIDVFDSFPGIAAATMFMPEKLTEVSESQLRVAFDGDAVLFSDESERIFKAHGLDKFFEHERENEDTLLDHVCSFLTKGCLDISFRL